MRIGVPAEGRATETRVAATPATVTQLTKLGYQLLIESGAGERADFPDHAYAEAGARVVSNEEVWDAEIILKTDGPTPEEVGRLRPGATIAATMSPAEHPEVLDQLADQGVTALALDAVPRISRAQSLDVLSSMANIAGYRAVIEAAAAYGRMFGGQVTAAGKMPPATVFVVGAGVAGLAAIGAASSMGAVVKAYDVRPEVAEQIESMGAEFVAAEVPPAAEADEPSDGYAKEMSAELERAVLAMYAEQTRAADIVITTALIRGRPAPKLITAEMVAAMRPGSVIVDMAAAMGGNCELTVPGEKIVTDNGVTIIGYTDLAARLPAQASQLYGTNLVNLMKLLTPEKDGTVVLDLADEVQRGITVTHEGSVLWPPPPVAVSAAPAVPQAAEVAPATPEPKASGWAKVITGVIGLILFGLIAAFSPPGLLTTITIFILAIFVGYYVISNVTHALHTPLMAETNAISGIILVGALLQIGSDNLVVTILSYLAVTVASINIFGGFLVSQRMLNMFRKD
ncbi:Re/Si-specific NAD(P)(+) transhydrogenase subunit alpha [Enemella sp. A6]|uniref:Re/Si-specific NAD(P)(+) transhydrogenase subunit alpha n=1 Tax=Enemella sp. A6 TaxID=3440152 RepID=UPI003EB6BA81